MNEQVLYNRPLPGTPLNMAHPLTRGLVGAWLFNENGGIRAMDVSPYRNHALLQGFPSPVPHSFTGLPFRNAGFATAGNNTSLNPTVELMVEVWFKQIVAGVFHCFVSKGADLIYNFRIRDTNVVQFYIDQGDTTSVAAQTTTTITLNQWVHLMGTARNKDGKLRVYINGQLDTTGTAFVGVNTGATAVNLCRRSDNVHKVQGDVALIRIWNGSPNGSTADIVRQLYQSPYDMFLKREA